MPAQTLIGLILCNLVWSVHPAMAKLILADFPPATAAWLRYASALIAYIAAAVALSARRAERSRRSRGDALIIRPRSFSDAALIVIVGFMGFCFAPMMQFTGLQDSRATDNALIIAMEPLITVFLARIFLKERLSKLHWIAFSVALAGFAILTDLAPSEWTAAGAWGAHTVGNFLMLAALLGEASYSVAGRKLVSEKNDPVQIFGAALAIGVIFLTPIAIAKDGPIFFHLFSHLSLKSALAILFVGPIGTALAYFYWMTVLVDAPVASLALTLFIQPVCGSVWGYLFLDERLSEMQSFGALLIVGAVLMQSIIAWSRAMVAPIEPS